MSDTQPVAIVYGSLGRSMGSFVADCVVDERHDDSWVITDHPVEQGAVVSDHIYKLPASVTLTYIWTPIGHGAYNTSKGVGANGNDVLQNIYEQLLQINSPDQTTKLITPFTIVTGKRMYTNMLVQNIAVTTDKTTENILSVRITCRELLIADSVTETNLGNAETPADEPVVAQGTVQPGAAPTVNTNNIPPISFAPNPLVVDPLGQVGVSQ